MAFDIENSGENSVKSQKSGEFNFSQEIEFKPANGKLKAEYHEQRLTQSKRAFDLSVRGSIIGFIVIICSVIYGIYANESQWPGIASGVIVEAVSVLFYTISNAMNEKISEFFKELTKDSNVETAVRLSNDIADPMIKDNLKTKLALFLSGIDEEKICKNYNEVCNKKENT